jgi:hypothetical protein
MQQRIYDPGSGSIIPRGAESVYAPAAQTWTPGNVETEDPHDAPFTTLDGADGDGEEDGADDGDLVDPAGGDDIEGMGDDPADPCCGPATSIVASAGPLSRSRSQPVNWI